MGGGYSENQNDVEVSALEGEITALGVSANLAISVTGEGTVADGGTVTGWDSSSTKSVTVKVTNIGGSNNTNNILKVTIPEGLKLVSYPKSDDPTLGAFLNSVTEPAVDALTGAQFGDLIYNIKDTASSLTFNIQVRPDDIRFYGAHTVPNPVAVELTNSETAGGSPIESDFTVGVTGAFSPLLAPVLAIDEYFANLDEVFSTGVYTYRTQKGSPLAAGQTLYKEAALTLEYPAQAELVGLHGYTTPTGHLSDYNAFGIPGVQHDATAHKVTLYYENVKGTGSGYITDAGLRLKLKTDLGAVAGSSYKITKLTFSYKTYDNVLGEKVTTPDSPVYTVTVPGINTLKVAPQDWNVAPAPDNFDGTGMLPGYSVVGRFAAINDKGVELTNQTVRYDFPRELNVRGFDLPTNQSTLTTKIYYKKYDDTKVYEQNFSQAASTLRVRVKPSDLTDLGTGTLEYAYANCGNFPAGYRQGANTSDGTGIFGNLNKADYVAGSSWTTYITVTGEKGESSEVVASAVSAKAKAAGAENNVQMSGHVSDFNTTAFFGSAVAGDDIPIWASFNTYSGLFQSSAQRMRNPVFYVVIPEGLSVDPASVWVKRNSYSGTDIEFNTVERSYTDSSGQNPKTVLVISTKNCIVGQLTEDLARLQDVRFGFKYSTSPGMNTLSENLSSLIFAGPEEGTYSDFANPQNMRFGATIATSGVYSVADSYNFNNNLNPDTSARRTDWLSTVTSSGNNYINILEKKELVIGAKIKLDTEDDSAYRTYDGTDASKVVFTPGTRADYQVTLENRSDYAADSLAVYIPVPKIGQTLGPLFQNAVSPWNMKLVGSIDVAGTDASKYTISYGQNVVAGGFEDTSKYTATPGPSFDWNTVNVVKIEAIAPIPKDSKTTVNLKYDVDVTEAQAGTLSGTDNIFNPYYYVDYSLATGYYGGAKVAANLQLASIQGMVFIDTDKNGIKDGAEEFYTGADVTVTATSVSTSTTRTVTTDATGHYSITGLKGASDYVVSFTLPTGYVRTVQNISALSTINSDVIRKGTGEGTVSSIDTSHDSSRSVNAGYAINSAPILTVNNILANINGGFATLLKVASILDDFDTIPVSAALRDDNLSSNPLPSTLVAGTYEVVYKATDSDGAEGNVSQVVKVDGLPVSVGAVIDMVRPVLTPPSLQELVSRVNITYPKASDTVGGQVTTGSVVATITSPPSVPSTVGKYQISYSGKPSTTYVGTATTAVTGSYNLTLTAAPVVTATANSANYVSAAKTNQNVIITVAGAPGLTIKYRKGDSGAWTDLQTTSGAAGTLTVTDEELATYQFIYADGTTEYDGTDEVTSFTTDINKKAPKLTDGTDEIVNAKTYFKYPETNFAVTGVSQGVSDTVSSSYIKDATGSPIAYTDGSALDFGSYEFTLTDGYGNLSTYDFAIDHLWKVKFAAGDGGGLTGQTTVADIENGTKWEDVFDGFGGSGSANIPVPVADDNHTFSQWNVAFPAATDAIHADATYTAIFAGNLSVSANDASATYDGAAHGLTGAIATVGAVNAAAGTVISYGESASGPWESTSPTYTNAGTYTVYIKATNSDTVNFVDSPVVSKTVTIAKRGITVKPVNASKVYDGNILKHTDVELVSGSLVSGHSLNISGATFTGAQTDVGTSNGSVSGVSISGGDVANYEISYVDGSLTVTAAPVEPVTPDTPDKPEKPDTPLKPEKPSTPDADNKVMATAPAPTPTPVVPASNDEVNTLPTPDSTTTVTTTPNGGNGTDGGTGAPVDGGGVKAPTSNIDGNRIPFAAPLNGEYWSLIDLLFVLLGMAIAIQKTVVFVRRRNNLSGDYDDAQVSASKPKWLFATIGIAIVSLAAFLLSQDITGNMAIIDGYTTIFVVLFTATMVAGHFSTKKGLKNA